MQKASSLTTPKKEDPAPWHGGSSSASFCRAKTIQGIQAFAGFCPCRLHTPKDVLCVPPVLFSKTSHTLSASLAPQGCCCKGKAEEGGEVKGLWAPIRGKGGMPMKEGKKYLFKMGPMGGSGGYLQRGWQLGREALPFTQEKFSPSNTPPCLPQHLRTFPLSDSFGFKSPLRGNWFKTGW